MQKTGMRFVEEFNHLLVEHDHSLANMSYM